MDLDPLDQPPAGTSSFLDVPVTPVDTEAIWTRAVCVIGVLVGCFAFLVPLVGAAGPGLSLLVTVVAGFYLLRRHVPAVARGSVYLSGVCAGVLVLWLS